MKTLNILFALAAIVLLGTACGESPNPAETYTDMNVSIICNGLADGETCPDMDVTVRCLVRKAKSDGSDDFYSLTKMSDGNVTSFGTKHGDDDAQPSDSCTINLDLPEGFELDGQMSSVAMPDSAPIDHEVAIKKSGGTVIVDPPLVIDLSVDSASAEALESKIEELDGAVEVEVNAFVCDYEYDEMGINSLRAELPSLNLNAHAAGVDHRDRADLAVSEAYEGCGANSDELCTEASEEIIALRAMADRCFDAVDDSAISDLSAENALEQMAADQAVCDLPVVVDPVSTITPELLDVGSWLESSAEVVRISLARDGAFVGESCEIAAGDSRVCPAVEVEPGVNYSVFAHFGPADPASWVPLASYEVSSPEDGNMEVQIPVYAPAP